MKVYGHPASTCTRAVLTVLAEKGHEAEFVLIDLSKGEQKLPAHVARQPFGVVPVLETDDGFQMYESRAIVRFLDRTLPGVALTPADPKAYARMEQFISVEHCYFSPAAMKIIYERLLKPMRGLPMDEANVQAGREALRRPFEVVDAVLAQQQFLAGDAFSLAEVCWAPYMEYLFAVGQAELVAQYPSLNAWWNRVSTRPSWKRVTGR
ncbi:glutathione S-transferase N-terminal domain-containing protein [Myxococcaceae bacterium JPH2]|nr:glutathione S-transferase N-terminal domain-containing protein [Myxococcaceae bacterium JPH2]